MFLPDAGPIVVVGATGAVGAELLSILAGRGVEGRRIRAVASERSIGASIRFGGAGVVAGPLERKVFDGASIVFFTAGASVSRRWAPVARDCGSIVIDNSSAFRLDPDVPLVIPEVNGDTLGGARLVANPNCSTILLSLATAPLRRAFGVASIVVSTYQAVSGAGLSAIAELRAHSRAALSGRRLPTLVFPESCAFNIFSHESATDPDDGINGEERKIINETRRIWSDPELAIAPTCIRVPVVRAHSQSIRITLRTPATEEEIRSVLSASPGLAVIDDRAAGRFPTPLAATGRDEALVGRIRRDPGEPTGGDGRSRVHLLLACMDQLRKGAALNAVQIVERRASCHSAPRAAGVTI